MLAPKNDQYRSWADVEPIIRRVLDEVNAGREVVSGDTTLTDFIEKQYLPWCEANKSAATANDYKRRWENSWKDHIGEVGLTALQTPQVTAVLTKHAKAGKGNATLSHIKWFLSGVYQFAIASGIVPKIRCLMRSGLSKWHGQRSRGSIPLRLSCKCSALEPLDLRAAVAVALAYFAALRPAEIRGLKWEDYDGEELDIKRAVWRNKIGETKTEDSAATVPIIEPLKSLLEKLREESAAGFILENGTGNL